MMNCLTTGMDICHNRISRARQLTNFCNNFLILTMYIRIKHIFFVFIIWNLKHIIFCSYQVTSKLRRSTILFLNMTQKYKAHNIFLSPISKVITIKNGSLLAIKIATPERTDLTNFKISWKEEEIRICKWLVFQRI